MPRQARLDSPGTLHHVMIRGIEGRSVFLGDEDREEFLWRMRELSLDTGTQVIEKVCGEADVKVEELRGGNQRRRVAEVRAKVAYGLNRDMGISMAEIARHLGVGASAIAMAIRKEDRGK